MSAETSRQERYLLDRQAILDCVSRYCRAVDRHDRELLATVFHDDARIDLGDFEGGPQAFAAQALNGLAQRYAAHSHNITSHNCTVDGEVAHAESYVL
ncbi:MAG: nuclear transport factor 2 family protein, partial [Pseudomonadota bacterium]|nr:nuclear transport factor 2 family protein [Pseudomonadota bacterium]